MTTPGGVPNLPIGALTVETLASRLQDQTATAMRSRAGEQMPAIFGASNGGDIMSDLSPFGILTNIWAGINSLIANSDPNDIQGPDDLPPLFTEFIENLPVIGQFVELLEALSGNYDGDDPTLNSIQDLLAPIRLLVDTIGQGIADLLAWIWDNFGEQVETLLKPLIEFLAWLWQGAPGGFSGFGAQVESLLKPLTEWLHWLWSQFGSVAETFLKPILTWLKSIWDLFGGGAGGSTVLTALFSWLNDLWTKLGATILAAFNNLVQSVSGLISLPTLQNLIEKIAAAFTGVLNPQAFVDLLIQIVNYFTSLFKTKSLTDFTNSLPIIGPLVSAITGLTEADGVSLDLGQLGSFFRKLEKQATISDDTLADIGRKVMGGILSIGMLNTTEPNLLSQGDFATAATIEAADGWSWDNTVSATSTGGALLATATGSLQQMYSKQSIKVLTNDKIKVSASVRTSGFTSGSMTLSIVYWVGSTPTTHVVATRTSSASTFQPMTGSTIVIGGTAGSGEISIPSGATSIQVRLAVNANAGAQVWFDDIAVRKTGLVEQTWVDKLPETWVGAWNAVFGSGGTGKIWSDFITALSTTYTKAKNGEEGSTTANGNITTMIDGIGQAVFGDAGYASLSKTVKESVRKLVATLFGVNYVTTELSGEVMPPLDGTTITGEVPVDSIPDLPGGIITTGTINPDRLPSSLTAVGSGVIMLRTGSLSSPTTYWDGSGRKLDWGFYNSNSSLTTDDITVSNIGGYTAAKASNAGWYMVELGFQLRGGSDLANYAYHWGLTGLIYKSSGTTVPTVPYKWGNTGVCVVDTFNAPGLVQNSWTSDFCNSSFIVYLNANDTIFPGYFWSRESDLASDTIIKSTTTTNSYGTYFGMSLLNRSLA